LPAFSRPDPVLGLDYFEHQRRHSFAGLGGVFPLGNLIFDAAGNLYGTTLFGGIHPCQGGGCGTVFQFTP
jgi:uncharacterized repeat protein (TIGR03803 family)